MIQNRRRGLNRAKIVLKQQHEARIDPCRNASNPNYHNLLRETAQQETKRLGIRPIKINRAAAKSELLAQADCPLLAKN